jgi:hypothetical protein
MGPTAAAQWIAAGSNFADLPDETKQYVTRASEFLEKNSMARRINSDSNTSITAGLDKTQEAKEARREELTKQVREQYPKISLPMLESIVKPILAKEFNQPEVAGQRKGQTGVLSDPVPMLLALTLLLLQRQIKWLHNLLMSTTIPYKRCLLLLLSKQCQLQNHLCLLLRWHHDNRHQLTILLI